VVSSMCLIVYVCARESESMVQVDSSDATEIAVALLVMAGDSILYLTIQIPTLLIAAYP
jgi:hypothetical protein